MTSSTPEAPEPGTQMYTTKQNVKMRTSVSDGMIYVAFGNTGTPEETIVTFSPEQAYYLAKRLTVLAASTARLAPRADALIERDDVAAWLQITFGPAVNRTVRYNPPGLPNGYWEDRADDLLALLPRALMPDDTEQIDDQVQDVLTTIICREVELEYGHPVDPESRMMDEIRVHFWKDLASLGIRLTYDTTIGGGK